MTILITSLLFTLIISFLCSLFESVILSITFSDIHVIRSKNRKLGKILEDQKNQIEIPLTAILTINTISHTVGSVVVGAQAVKIFGDKSVFVISVVFTLLILFLSEVIPKAIGSNYPEKMAKFTGYSLGVMIKMTYPIVIVSQFFTDRILPKKDEPTIARSDFQVFAEIGLKEGQMSEKEVTIFKNLLLMSNLETKDILTPRTVMFTLPDNLTVDEFVTVHYSSSFSRIPIHKVENEDDMTGVILKSDLISHYFQGVRDKPILEFARKIKAVPDTMRVSELFYYLVDKKIHLALVADEYGSVEGLVSIEDIVECLIGREIVDESDQVADMRNLASKKWQQKFRRYKMENKIMHAVSPKDLDGEKKSR